MILVTGATGFLGKRVCKALTERSMPFLGVSRQNGPDLRDRQSTLEFFDSLRPTKILNCAAFVGGIQFGYKHPVELFHNNLALTMNLLEGANACSVQRIVNPISNCAYPGAAKLFKETEFWDGPLHESVLVYGFVRKASWIGSWAYYKQYGLDVVNLILSNMYGPEDHFEEERSHALGALIMKIVRAKHAGLEKVSVWGSGQPVREWLHVDDGAEAMVRALDIDSTVEPINVGIGKGISIIAMATLIKEIVGYSGELVLDKSKPDGAPHKTVDGTFGTKILNWSPTRDFESGVAETIKWYLQHEAQHD